MRGGKTLSMRKRVVIDSLEACGYDVLDNVNGGYLQICLQTKSGMGFFYTVWYSQVHADGQIVSKIVSEMNRTIRES